MSQKSSWAVRIAGVGAVVGVVGMLAAAGVAYATVPTFSQSNITVGVSQSTSISATNGTGVYMELNTSPTTVSVTTNGSQLTVIGLAPGTATLTICGTGTASDCTNIGVTVQATAVSTTISFSQTSPTLNIGGNTGITISGGTNSYSVSSNSNTSVVSTSLSGNILTVTGLESGSATIDVCDSSSHCNSFVVTVNSSGTSTSTLSFSENNITLSALSATQSVTVSGGDGVYNIDGNSSPSVASAGISSNSVIVESSGYGSTTMTVCDSSNPALCGSLYVTVGSSGSTTTTSNQAVTFNPASPSLAVGQTLNVALSGSATEFFISLNGSPNVAEASISNGTTLALTGEVAGTDPITVCASGGAGCSQLSVTVTGSGTAPTTTTTPTTTTVTPTTTTTTGTTVTNAALLAEIQTLQSAVTQTLTQIESIQSQLNQVEAQVNAGAGSGISTDVSASAGSYDFTELLTIGSEDAQVTALQQRLTTLGFYSGPITGFYGSLTEDAVMKYQTSHGIEATGEVGPETRAALNAGS